MRCVIERGDCGGSQGSRESSVVVCGGAPIGWIGALLSPLWSGRTNYSFISPYMRKTICILSTIYPADEHARSCMFADQGCCESRKVVEANKFSYTAFPSQALQIP